MITREEKNKEIVNELKREKAINLSKKIFKIFIIIFFLFTSFFMYTYFLGVKGLRTKEYLVIDADIPDSFSGIKILHLTDLLYGKTTFEREIKKLEEEVKLINPDIVFFTGNIISNDYEINKEERELITDFFQNIPYKIGKYAIRGKNDKTDFDLIMENTNFNILDNEQENIYYNDTDFIHLIGLNNNEIKEVPNDSNSYTITLINNYDEYEKYHVTSSLVLAGYNLGGEIRLFNNPILGEAKYLDNYYEINNEKIYISSGIGTVHHARLFNKPSMNVYRLYNKNIAQ